MTPSLRARTSHRTLADRRLSDLTAIAAVSGLTATIGFGWLAAMTYAGVGSTSTAPNDSPNVVSAPRTVVGNNDPSVINGGSTTTRSTGQWRHWFVIRWILERRVQGQWPGAHLDRLVLTVLEQAAWRALGTNAHLFVLDGDLAKARASVERLLADVDMAYSRFRSDSELMRLQASPTRSGPVSPLLWLAVTTALDVAHETDGAVDPTIGTAMRIIGYDDDFSRVVRQRHSDPGDAGAGPRLAVGPPGRADENGPDPGGRRARSRLERQGARVRPGRDGCSCGRPGRWRPGQPRRGYRERPVALRRAAGGSSPARTARRPRMRRARSSPSSPVRMATSSTTVRRWSAGDGTYLHHLVDPWTGAPVDGPWRTVTVAAETCVAANAWATAAIVLGDRGLAMAEERGLAARAVAQDGRIVRVGGWPEPVADPVGQA